LISRNHEHALTSERGHNGWKFFTNHALVLLAVAADPEILLREIAEAVGITERAAHRIIGDLEAGGYISRKRKGRRNYYQVHPDAVISQPGLNHPMLEGRSMGQIAAQYLAAGRHDVGEELGVTDALHAARERLAARSASRT
jgi:DNA-binding IclR family transcriptional regulator